MSGTGPAAFSVTVEQAGGRTVVGARGELDLATAPELEAALMPPLDQGTAVALDLRGLGFMDSTGVRVIVAAQLAAQEHGGALTVCAVPDGPVARVLEISGLDAVLDVVDTL
ncbi:MAG TPA: STAS domain-containing protein [Baekduia sp.]|nr:STAS domain-containing protein [Baekduia sp.]